MTPTTPAITAEEIAELEQADAQSQATSIAGGLAANYAFLHRNQLLIRHCSALLAEARAAAALRQQLAAEQERRTALDGEVAELRAEQDALRTRRERLRAFVGDCVTARLTGRKEGEEC